MPSGRGFCDELITRPEESPTVVRRCVESRNLQNEVIARVGRFTTFNRRIRRITRNIKIELNMYIILNRNPYRRLMLKSGYL
jgi:hypothetical protein